MEIHGRVQNGVIVLEDGPPLPEGAAVTVSCDPAPLADEPAREKQRVETKTPAQVPAYLTFGKYATFPGKMSTLDDFKKAEWRGNDDFDSDDDK